MKNFKTTLCVMLLLMSIAAFGQSGSIDTTFGSQGYLSKSFWGKNIYGPATIALQNDGKIIAGASIATTIYYDMVVTRFTANGALDSTFGDTGKIIVDFLGRNDGVTAIVVLTDGKILIGGYAKDAAGIQSYALMKITTNGKLDSSFGLNGKQILSSSSAINAMGMQSNGKIIIAGNSNIARLFPDGTIDPSFGINGIVSYSEANDMIVANNDQILVTGGIGMKTCRFLPDGVLDLGFGVNGAFENFDSTICSATGGNRQRKDFNAQSICIDVTGNIYVGGQHNPRSTTSPCYISTHSIPVVVKLTPSGTLASGFGTNGWAYPVASNGISDYNNISLNLQTNTNKLLVSSITGNKSSIYRLKSTGVVDTIFGNYGVYILPNSGLTAAKFKNILQNDSLILAVTNWTYTIGMSRVYAGETPTKPSAYFVDQTSPLATGTAIEFTDGSKDSYSRIWRFSPNTISYALGLPSSWTMKVIFNQPGTYAISLTVFNINHTDSSEIVKYYLIGAKPTIKFGVNTSIGDTGSVFNFVDSSSDVPTTWLWTFTPNNVIYQNGTSSSSKNPIVKFTSQGFYAIKLKATNPYGMDTLTKTNYIIITKSPNPNFISNQFGDTNAVFNFLDATVSSSPLTYQWSFLPNNISFLNSTDSSSQNPLVKFKSYGYYTVKLKVKSINGEDSTIKTNWIEIGHSPVALFGSSQFTGTTTTKFNLKDSSAYGPNKRKWTFFPSTVLYQNGTKDTSQNPIVSFTQIGMYTVRLVVTNLYGVDSVIKSSYFQIGPMVTANFGINTTLGTTNTKFNLNDSSSNNPTSWLWSFSPATVTFHNGTAATSQNPVVSFTNIGAYTAKLVVTNLYGVDSIIKCNVIQIGSLPVANFVISDTIGFVTKQFNLYDSSLNNPTSRLWSFFPATVTFHNGTSSMSLNPVVSFMNIGTYEVRLVVNNMYGADSIIRSNYIQIGSLPVANFTISDTIGFVTKQFNLYDSSLNNPTSRLWSFFPATVTFHNGTSSTSLSPVVSFMNIGTYEVRLVVNNMYGADSIIRSNYIQIGSLPVANFTISDTVGTTSSIFNLYDSSSNAPNSWLWSFLPSTVTFQSGTSSTSRNPIVSFNNAGNYQLKLVVQNSYGKDSIIKSNLIAITTGMREEMQADRSIISLYPNPSAGEVFMNNIFGSNESAEMQVFNLKGEIVLTKTLYPESYKTTLILLPDNHPISNGLYFIKMEQDGHSYKAKLSINR